MPVLTVEKPLRDSLGNDAAIDSLIRLINESREEEKRDTIEFVEEKFERRLSEEIGGLEVRLSEKINSVDKGLSKLEGSLDAKISALKGSLDAKISALKGSFDAKISASEGSLDAKISASKADIIKWMFIFWVGQVGMILGILFAFFK